MVDPVVAELGNVEDVIGGIRVGINNRIRNDLPPDNRKERLLRTSGIIIVWDFAAALEEAEDGDLAGCAAPALALANRAKIALESFSQLRFLGRLAAFAG